MILFILIITQTIVSEFHRKPMQVCTYRLFGVICFRVSRYFLRFGRSCRSWCSSFSLELTFADIYSCIAGTGNRRLQQKKKKKKITKKATLSYNFKHLHWIICKKSTPTILKSFKFPFCSNLISVHIPCQTHLLIFHCSCVETKTSTEKHHGLILWWYISL